MVNKKENIQGKYFLFFLFFSFFKSETFSSLDKSLPLTAGDWDFVN